MSSSAASAASYGVGVHVASAGVRRRGRRALSGDFDAPVRCPDLLRIIGSLPLPLQHVASLDEFLPCPRLGDCTRRLPVWRPPADHALCDTQARNIRTARVIAARLTIIAVSPVLLYRTSKARPRKRA